MRNLPFMLTSAAKPERYHSLDALRATMMLLGIVLHAAANYTQAPMKAWSVKDTSVHFIFDILFYFIHLFRMPVFFMSAGFFAALLYEKRGIFGMIRNRTMRVLLPLLASFLLIIPLYRMSFVFTMNGGGKEGWAAATDIFASFSDFIYLNLAHLWFLYYLLLLYILAIVFAPLGSLLIKIIPSAWRLALSPYIVHPVALPVLSFVTYISLLPMARAELETYTSLFPAPHVLLAYSVFFAYGWIVYHHSYQLAYLKKHWRTYLIAGLASSTVYLFIFLGKPVAQLIDELMAGKILAAVSMWLLIYASIALFERFFSKLSPLVRYLSDASYWMYLIHLPIVLFLVGLLAGFSLPAIIKFTIVLGITLLFSLLTYHYLVRATIIGVFLNGRRYAKSLSETSQVIV